MNIYNCTFIIEDEKLIFIPQCMGSINRGIEKCTCEIKAEKIMEQVIKLAYERGELKANKKCCGKCAFRSDSPERCDQFGWLTLCESIVNGNPFFCHEGLIGHQHASDGMPVRVCAGYQAMKNKPLNTIVSLAHCDDRSPSDKFN